jgi:hypothetical protein
MGEKQQNVIWINEEYHVQKFPGMKSKIYTNKKKSVLKRARASIFDSM